MPKSKPVSPVTFNQENAWPILRRSLGYLRPYMPLVIGAYLTILVNNAIAATVPQFIRWIVDRGIGEQNSRLIAWSVLALLGLTLLKGISTFLQGRWSEVASQSVAYDLRKAIQQKLLALSFAYHDKTEAGQLLSRSLQDVERIRFLTGRALLRIVDAVALMLITGIILLTMNLPLALLALATMPFLAQRGLYFGQRFRPLSRAIQDQLAVLTTRLEQNLRGARIVKAFAQEDAEVERFQAENRKWFSLAEQTARLRTTNLPLLDLIANVGTVIIIWYGGYLVINNQLTLGELVAFTTYLAQLVQPVRRLGVFIAGVAMSLASGERVYAILDAPSEVEEKPDAIELPAVEGHVRFEDVSFTYLGRHKVLHNINFEAKPGQIIALLGATGSGKSTIVNLVPRFYDAEGRVTVDGYDVKDVTISSLRDQIGIVLQETTLFSGTIRENIGFGKPGATEEEIVEAAKAAQAHDFIVGMPHGYDTEVGERGVTLSGGQKQRVAIARALLTDPRILILDDATSSVDTETEHLIQKALENLMRGRTTFVIAQRLSTVRQADLILVLEKGRIIDRGQHADLLRTSELYAQIYHQQLRPQAGGELDFDSLKTGEA